MEKYITKEQSELAVGALRAYLNGDVVKADKKSKKSKQLLDSDEYFELQVNLLKVPVKQKRLIPVRLPVSIYKREGVKICLLTKDPQDEWEDFLKKNPVSNVHKVIALKQLFTDFKPYEHRRVLAKQFDLFFADRAIIPMIPSALGKAFYNNPKEPIGVDLSTSFKKHLQTARDSTYFSIPTGVAVSLKFAHSQFSDEDVLANLRSALPQMVEHLPKKWDGILSIYIKTTTSAALPLYLRKVEHADFGSAKKRVVPSHVARSMERSESFKLKLAAEKQARAEKEEKKAQAKAEAKAKAEAEAEAAAKAEKEAEEKRAKAQTEAKKTTKTTKVALKKKATEDVPEPKVSKVALKKKLAEDVPEPKVALKKKVVEDAPAPKTAKVALKKKAPEEAVPVTPKTTKVALKKKVAEDVAPAAPKTTKVASKKKVTEDIPEPKATKIALAAKTTKVAAKRKTLADPTPSEDSVVPRRRVARK